MKNHWLWNFASHSTIVLSIVFLVFFIIDRINPAMEFLGSEQSDWLLLLFCCCACTSGILSAINLFRLNQARYERKDE